MAGRRYHDFVIFTHLPETEPDGSLNAFTLRIFGSPAGEGEIEEKVPIPDYRKLIDRRRQLGSRKLGLDERITFGQRLAELLLPPYAHRLFRDSLLELGPDEGLRLRLRLLDQLSHLPWEYMYLQEADGRATASNFLVLDPRISIVRHEARAIPAQRIPPGTTRRVFIAMATPKPFDRYDRLEDLPLEQRMINEALRDVQGTDVTCLPDYRGMVEWETIPGARPEDLQAEILKLDQVDIFHFSGHGGFKELMTDRLGVWEGTGHIILASENNEAVFVPGDELATMLRERGIRLVTLGACETAMTNVSDVWGSVAGALLEGRIPSVVAMQFSVYSKLTAVFMAAVYEALMDGRTIDEAVFHGRAAVRARSYGEFAGARDWGTPVLYSRVPSGHIFPPVTDKLARQQAQQSIETRSNLHQAWWEWMDKRAMASKYQLRELAKVKGLDLQPTQILLLLRSALFEDEPIDPWLTQLRARGANLIAKLDSPGDYDPSTDDLELTEGGEILGLGNAPSVPPQDVGAVAWTAVSHTDATTRQAAAVTLSVLPAVPEEGLERLDRALRGVTPRWRRFARKAELRGTLADGDPEIEKCNADLPPWDRVGIWFWRFWRRARRERNRIRALVFGAAIGAGVALGTLRGLLGIPAGPLAMTRFAINFYWGALLGAVIGLGVGLAEPMLVRRRGKPANEARPFWRALFPPARRLDLMTLLLGTLFFGVMHLLVGWFNGLNLCKRSLILATGTLTGFGVNLALYHQPKTGYRQGIGCWLLRIFAAALPAVMAQRVIIASGLDWAATAITRTGAHLRDNFGRYDQIFQLIDDNQDFFSYLDAALVGILLMIGITVGWHIALKRKENVSGQVRDVEN